MLELDSTAIGDIEADHPLSQGDQRSVCKGSFVALVC